MAQPFNLTVAAQTLLIGQLLCICIACSGIFSQVFHAISILAFQLRGVKGLLTMT
jgi:hypothetical protein